MDANLSAHQGQIQRWLTVSGAQGNKHLGIPSGHHRSGDKYVSVKFYMGGCITMWTGNSLTTHSNQNFKAFKSLPVLKNK